MPQSTITRREFALGTAGFAVALAASRFASPAWGEGSFTPGTYIGEGQGKSGPVRLECTFSDSAIQSIDVIESHEHATISAVAFERIPAQIIECQTLDLNTVAGATLSSYAIMNAVAEAVEQAGAQGLEGEAPAKEPREETIDADLVVVGAGGAGTACAIVAAQQGYSVVLLEAASNMGGNTTVSGGFLEYINAPAELRKDINDGYIAAAEQILANPPVESDLEQQIVDTARQQWEEYLASGDSKVFDSPEFFAVHYQSFRGDTIANQYLVAKSRMAVTQWLQDLGMEFIPLVPIVGSLWPRWTRPAQGSGGLGYFLLFEDVIANQGLPIDLKLETRATKLLGDGGRVTGVVATSSDGVTYTVNSSKGVILACGGFSGNSDLIKKYNEFWDFSGYDILPTTNAAFHVGDGIRMAEEFGAAVEGAWHPMLFPLANPQNGILGGMVGDSGNFCFVNKDGRRFVNESADRFTISQGIMDNGDVCYVVCAANNSNIREGTDLDFMVEQGQVFVGDTLEELAQKAGIDAENLVATIEAYNEYARDMKDPEFGRTTFTENSPLLEGPYYASPRTWSCHITEGGLPTASHFEDYHVLATDGTPIEGLYACGEARNLIAGVGSIGDGYTCVRSIID